MTLAAGSRLGPYEIVAPIGAGGMGEVYRVRDAKLGRDVDMILGSSSSTSPTSGGKLHRRPRRIDESVRVDR